eukprot:1144729-Pelagomonas_calceolata.AAC.9
MGPSVLRQDATTICSFPRVHRKARKSEAWITTQTPHPPVTWGARPIVLWEDADTICSSLQVYCHA